LKSERTRVERAQTKPYDRHRIGSGNLDENTSLVVGRPFVTEGASPVEEKRVS